MVEVVSDESLGMEQHFVNDTSKPCHGNLSYSESRPTHSEHKNSLSARYNETIAD